MRYSVDSKIRHIPISIPEVTITATENPAEKPKVRTDTRPVNTRPINFLIIGSDSRISGGDPKDWHYGAQRSDVLMVMQLSGNREAITIMSIPRDSWVDIPGRGKMKINAAYSLGGAQLAIDTVRSLMGIHIDHFAIIDFESFAQLTDQLGGVRIKTTKGEQHFNGKAALRFVRERKSLPRGDFDRVRRQQAWIRALMTRLFKKEVLTDPAQLNSMLQTMLSYSAVDNKLTFDAMLNLAKEARSIRSSNITLMTAPFAGIDTSHDGQSIVVLDEKLMKKLSKAWAEDTTAEFIAANKNLITLKTEPIR